MAIKLSGMISGMDTDAMIDDLIKAYSVRKDSYVKDQKALEYKQEAWKDMNSKIYSLFSGKLSSLRFTGTYAMKKTKVSDTTKASITASTSAVNGTQELQIKSLAKSGYLTGGVVSSTTGGKLKGSSKLSDLGVTGSTLSVTVDGKETSLELTEDMTINKFVTALKERGLNASFDEANQRFFISSKTSGAAHDFSINANDANGTNALKSMGLYTVSTADISSYEDYISLVEGDSEYMTNAAKKDYLNSLINNHISEYNTEKSGYSDRVKELKEEITAEKSKKSFAALSDEKKEEKITALRDKITALEEKIAAENAKAENGETPDEAAIEGYNSEIEKLNDQIAGYEEIKDAVGSSEAEGFEDALAAYNAEIDGNIDALTAETDAENEKIAEVNDKIKTAQGYLKATIDDAEQYLADNNITVDYDSDEYNDFYSKYSDKYDHAKEMVADYEEYEQLKKDGTNATRLAELSAKLGLDQGETGASRIAGSDAEIYLNGALFTSNTNNFNINGLTITATALTDEDETITVTTDTDVDGIYDMIKDFFKEYNDLMKGMEEKYNAASAGDYEPLTDEEMEAMTDKQIEKWEDKVKTATLRRDSTLSGIVNLFKTNMMKSFNVDGENLSLASFGIKTLGYFNAGENERGLYHIDGDADDKNSSGNADKLKKAIASDPEKVIGFFTKLTENIYTQLNKKMSSSSMSSAYTVYNDKQMQKQYDDYDDTIEEWEDKVDAIREKYEKQFAAMETALSKLQSQSSYFSSMLGY